MTDIQHVLLDLLVDLDQICKQEHIEYYLCEETLLSSATRESFFHDCCQASVAMTPDNAKRFIAAAKKQKNPSRIVDSMCDNTHYPSFNIHYGNPDTLMMHLPYERESAVPCIGVTIHILRFKPRHFRTFHKYTEEFWAITNKPLRSFNHPLKKAVGGVCRVLKAVLGGKYFGRWLFRRWSAMYMPEKNAKNFAVGKGKYHYQRALLDNRSTVVLEGHDFYTFGDVNNYLTERFGESFATSVPKYVKPSQTLLVSASVSYQKYLEAVKAQGLDLEKMQQTYEKYNTLQGKVSKYNKIISRYYAIVDRTDKRYAMYEMYMPRKDEILEMHRQERFEELNDILKPYRSALYECYKKKLGLCFDKEIFEITMDLLKREGKEKYALTLKEMVPEQHWAPIVITNYKGEPV